MALVKTLEEKVMVSNIITMFRFVSEIAHQSNSSRAESMRILYEALLSARPGTLAFVTDHDYEMVQFCIDESFRHERLRENHIRDAIVESSRTMN